MNVVEFKKNKGLFGIKLNKLKQDKELVEAVNLLALDEWKHAGGFYTKLLGAFWCATPEMFSQLEKAFPKIAQAITLCRQYETKNVFSAFGIDHKSHSPKYTCHCDKF
jgi:hypothetical protein